MKKNKRFFIFSMPIILAFCSLFVTYENANSAPRTATRGTAIARKSVATTTTKETTNDSGTQKETTTVEPKIEESAPAPEIIVSNKSNQFENAISEMMESSVPDNSFAEEIRRQRAALAASDASMTTSSAQKNALATNSSSCDIALRKCMTETCGNDFTKCATDGDTIFGDKLNRCRKDSNCSGEEFSLFAAEIKADRDMNVRLSSYTKVVDCGNSYNACIVNECGTTYNKCLGKANADSAIQKCSTIARECTESDSALASRFGTAIGKLRESAEKDVKRDEERMYKLRDSMKQSCERLGAMFDERTFDCVYTINFFAGENQNTPTASRKRYAGDSFVCMQEWFGINATTYQENAYRETRSQTAASSAMLGSGLGTAAGLISSGAIDRALDTQKAKKGLKEECESQGMKLKNGECVADGANKEENAETPEETSAAPNAKKEQREANKKARQEKRAETKQNKEDCEKDTNKTWKNGQCIDKCQIENALTTKLDKDGKCKVVSCKPGYQKGNNDTKCFSTKINDSKVSAVDKPTKLTEDKNAKDFIMNGPATNDINAMKDALQKENKRLGGNLF